MVVRAMKLGCDRINVALDSFVEMELWESLELQTLRNFDQWLASHITFEIMYGASQGKTVKVFIERNVRRSTVQQRCRPFSDGTDAC